MNINEKPTPKQTPTVIIFVILSLLCLVTSVDRSIVGGAFDGIASFVSSAPDTPEFLREHPSAGVGLISSIFIVGYSVSMLITGHLTHVMKWKNIVFGGMVIWTVAVWLSGFSSYVNSFTLLFVSRLISGVAEASFYVVAPPLIEDRGGAHSGLWMSIFVGAFPLGVSIGIFYGAYISNEYNWSYCFYIMAYSTLPLVISVYFIHDNVNEGVLAPNHVLTSRDGSEEDRKTQFSFSEGILTCLKSRKLVAIILADSAQIAATTVLGTFGNVLIFSLDLFDTEESAALAFGVVLALAAVTGTPFGGMVVDATLEKLGTDPCPDEVLCAILPKISIGAAIGLCFFLPTCIDISSKTLFMTLMFIGSFFLFSIQSAIMRCILNSVDKDHRPNAVGMNAVLKHILGDIPATIIFGFVKDSLTPGCIIDSNGEFTDADLCKGEKTGSRITIFCIYAYFGLCIIFFELAHCFALSDMASKKKKSISNDDSSTKTQLFVELEDPVTSNRKEN